MSTTLLSSMAIPMFVIIVCVLFLIAYRLRTLHDDLCRTNQYLGEFHVKETLTQFFNKEKKPTKKREYWRDETGHRRWRKRKDA